MKAKLEISMPDAPNEISDWLKRLDLVPVQRKVWISWLKTPEGRKMLRNESRAEIGAANYEYFLEASLIESLDVIILSLDYPIIGPGATKLIRDKESIAKVNRQIHTLYENYEVRK